MAISGQNDYWCSRIAGPTSPAEPNGNTNKAWGLHDGNLSSYSLQDTAYRILSTSGRQGQQWGLGRASFGDGDILSTSSGDGWTIIIAFSLANEDPNTDTILRYESGEGTTAQVKIYPASGTIELRDGSLGSEDPTFTGVDLSMTDDYAVPVVLRMTVNESSAPNKVRLYLNEVIEDDDGNAAYIETTPAGSGTAGIESFIFGSTINDLDIYAVYVCEDGGYSPDEMDMSDFTSHSLMRTGMKVVEVLRNSRRLYLSNFVQSSGIFYGYDMSSGAMVNRTPAPTVHVMVQKADSPDFLTLAGTRTDQRYDVNVFVTTRGTNYENAYRMGATILGEVFDELYTNTGLDANVDSLISYNAVFDTKVDDDETICIHSLTLTYMKKIRMFLREV